MVSGKLNREELIRVAGHGEADRQARREISLSEHHVRGRGRDCRAERKSTTWDKFIEKRIFKPLGMKSFEHDRRGNTQSCQTTRSATAITLRPKRRIHVPMREIAAGCPRGRDQLERARHGPVASLDAERRRVRRQASGFGKEFQGTNVCAEQGRGQRQLRPRLVSARVERAQGRRAWRQH